MKISRASIIVSCMTLILLSSIGFSQTGQAMIMSNGVSVPSNFPHVYISTNSNPDTGLIFISTSWGSYPQYSMILDNTGAPVWYVCTGNEERRDFKVQPNGWLTMLVRDGYGYGGWGFIAIDENYNYVKTFQPINGYTTDEHELRVLENGGYLLIGRRNLSVNMNDYIPGDNRIANVRETCIQEFNAEDQLILEWPAFDYFDLADLPPEDLETSGEIYFAHMNAIDIDDDNNIILSSRSLSEITKINRQTKAIIWRLGGLHSDFNFVDDPLNGFSRQHAVRHTGHNRYLLFDNGNYHNPPVSRAVEYQLDIDQKTATLIWEYRNPEGTSYSYYMGNTQRLPNGNTLINWAISDRPKLTEVRPDCTVAFEMNYVGGDQCYRVHRFPWNGKALKPYLIAESHPDKITLVFNQFGDPDVDYYRIYGGTSPNPTALLDTSKLTLKNFTNLQNGRQCYFRVTSVSNGSESDYSNEETALVQIIPAGQNMVLNGDFSNGKEDWTWELQNTGSADWRIEDGVSHFDISNGGDNIYDVQLRQNGMPLIQGKEYLFEFDAWADADRLIEAKVGQDGGSYTNYSKIGYSYITTSNQHFEHSFTMDDPTDLNVRVVINTGTSDIDVYIDNISLKQLNDSGVHEAPSQIPLRFELAGNYPNPYNSETIISFSTQGKSCVKMTLYNLLGKFELELCNTIYDEGHHQIRFNGNKLSTGIYFCLMEATNTNGSEIYRDVHKMMLIK